MGSAPTGNVYSAGNTVIWELDPATGNNASVHSRFVCKCDFKECDRAVSAALLIVQNRLRCCLSQFKLCAHFLQTRSQRFNLLLLLRGVVL